MGDLLSRYAPKPSSGGGGGTPALSGLTVAQATLNPATFADTGTGTVWNVPFGDVLLGDLVVNDGSGNLTAVDAGLYYVHYQSGINSNGDGTLVTMSPLQLFFALTFTTPLGPLQDGFQATGLIAPPGYLDSAVYSQTGNYFTQCNAGDIVCGSTSYNAFYDSAATFGSLNLVCATYIQLVGSAS